MRAGLSTIQQTLTVEAAAVLNRSIAEAARRGHGQTTPLHVAATLLSSPSSLLRQACARSHPASAHPLQCRALDLCFSVALERLPSTNSSSCKEQQQPPISNALMAALKRAQAHQRRGCPEQQQQPILAVKVELEQLVISILDDPGVSRVMREASFSSPAVKATIEQSLSTSTATSTATTASNLCLNQRVHRGGGQQRDEIRRVMDVLVRTKKRNPILVGDNDPSSVMKEALRCIDAGEAPASLIGVKIVSVEAQLSSGDRAELPAKMKELDRMIQSQIATATAAARGVVLDLGDLKWLVENGGGQQSLSEAGRSAVAEMGRLVARYVGCGEGGLWLVGTASCPTYLRCQVYHPTMESDWDLQAVPIAARSPPIFPRSGCSGILSSSIESLSPAAKGLPAIPPPLRRQAETSKDYSGARGTTLCSKCTENCELELRKLLAEEFGRSSSESHPNLPKWLQIAPPTDQTPEHRRKQIAEELKKKWLETCTQTHPKLPTTSSAGGRRSPAPTVMTLSMANPFSLIPQPRQNPKNSLTSSQLSNRGIPVTNSVDSVDSPPSSPVQTDLVLGRNRSDIVSRIDDIDSFKRLFTRLSESVVWQPEAASAIATAIMQVKSGNGRQRNSVLKSDTWLLFVGPDKVGKSRMAAALSDIVCKSAPITINLGRPRSDGEESVLSFRGKTYADRIAEAVRLNPFSVVHLEEFDRADTIVRGMIRRAIECGRLPDSYGREVSLGNVIFILSSDWMPEDLRTSQHSLLRSEERILEAASATWQLELIAGESSSRKRRQESSCDGELPAKRTGLSLDLNLSVRVDDEAGEESRNSSDLTVEHEQDHLNLAINGVHHQQSFSSEFIDSVDEAIIFKPVDFGPLRCKISDSVSTKFASIMGTMKPLWIDGDALDRLVGGVWLAGAPAKFDEWAEKVLVPSFYQLKGKLKSEDGAIVRLSVPKLDNHHVSRPDDGDWLPKSVVVSVDGRRF